MRLYIPNGSVASGRVISPRRRRRDGKNTAAPARMIFPPRSRRGRPGRPAQLIFPEGNRLGNTSLSTQKHKPKTTPEATRYIETQRTGYPVRCVSEMIDIHCTGTFKLNIRIQASGSLSTFRNSSVVRAWPPCAAILFLNLSSFVITVKAFLMAVSPIRASWI